MSHTKETTIWCDHNRMVPGAIACMNFVQFAGRLAPARKHAEQDGWERIDGMDYCRDHKRFHRKALAKIGATSDH